MIISLLFFFSAFSQKDTTESEYVKTGFSFGALPVVAYDSDIGFKYGALTNLFHYGDGSNYPNYDHSLYLEWSRTTKGSGITQAIFDSRELIPKTRVNFEANYFTEQALDFYGFNGYQAESNSIYSDDSYTDNGYISRMYYRHSRELLRLKAEFQGQQISDELRWLAGFAYYGIKTGTVDIDKLNEGQDPAKMLPDTASLYDKYVEWGIIKDDQKDGGNVKLVKLGLVYDTRDNEANPFSGIWSDIILMTAPGFLGNTYSFSRLNITHRQYFTLYPKRLTFAYRLSYQTRISGETPFYMMPFFVDSKQTRDGLGGGNNLRGIVRNRIVGDGFAMGNFEFRWRAIKTKLFKQDFYIGLNAFMDAGVITNPYEFDTSGVTAGYGKTLEENLKSMNYQEEGIHASYGGGIRFVLNQNFIVSVDYGFAARKEDGTSGLYIGLNYIF